MKKLLPDYLVANVSKLDENFYKAHNLKAAVFDIDNTLVAHTEPEPPENILLYFEFLKSIGIKYAIVSNNSMERVQSFCKNLGIHYYYKALKPRKKYLKKSFDFDFSFYRCFVDFVVVQGLNIDKIGVV